MKKVLVVLAILLLAVSAHAQNLVNNGGFSNGLTGWSIDKSSWSPNMPYVTGGYDAHGPVANQSSATAPFLRTTQGSQDNFNTWAYQTVTGLTVGNTYDFSAMYGGGNGGAQGGQAGALCWWEVGLYAGGYSNSIVDGGAAANVVDKTELDYGGFGWKTAAKSFTATSDTYTIYLKQGRAGSNWQYYGSYWENVTLVDTTPAPPVPEPSSVIALGTGLMGMAGFIVRRRK